MKNSPSYLAFNDFFSRTFADRWESLHSALLREPRKIILSNPFGLQDYALDAASILPVTHLQFEKGQCMADLCASPGGKSLVAIFSALGEGDWWCGDLSPARVQRLKAVMHDCLPPEIISRVHVVRGDSSRWGLIYKDKFARVLVDAPCSGERHLLASPKEISRWTLKSSKRLAIRQHALLCAGLDSLVTGGRLVYSTCSISPFENDGVIEKLHKSRAGKFRVVAVQDENSEATTFGRIVLPDRFDCGPIYFSVLSKCSD